MGGGGGRSGDGSGDGSITLREETHFPGFSVLLSQVIFLESGFPFSTKYIPVPGTSTVLKTLVKFYLSSRLEPLLATTTKKD